MTHQPETGRPLLLVTNDDGIDAPGLWDLVRAVDGLGDLAVVAPASEQSWAGRAHRSDPGTAPVEELIRTVRSTERQPPGSAPALRCCVAVACTPARCVRLALTGMGLRPTLLLSGINPGSNGGALLTTSGTLGAAWEAAGSGVPAVAVSRPVPVDGPQTPQVMDQLRAVVAHVLQEGMPEDTAIVNVNFPAALSARPRWVVTRSSTRSQYRHLMTPRPPVDGVTTWDLEFRLEEADDPEPGSDLAVLREGDIGLTLLPARHGLLDDSWASSGHTRGAAALHGPSV